MSGQSPISDKIRPIHMICEHTEYIGRTYIGFIFNKESYQSQTSLSMDEPDQSIWSVSTLKIQITRIQALSIIESYQFIFFVGYQYIQNRRSFMDKPDQCKWSVSTLKIEILYKLCLEKKFIQICLAIWYGSILNIYIVFRLYLAQRQLFISDGPGLLVHFVQEHTENMNNTCIQTLSRKYSNQPRMTLNSAYGL